jgi:hypothetical protein
MDIMTFDAELFDLGAKTMASYYYPVKNRFFVINNDFCKDSFYVFSQSGYISNICQRN